MRALVWRAESSEAEAGAANSGAWEDDLAGDPGSGELPDIVELRPEEAVRSSSFCRARGLQLTMCVAPVPEAALEKRSCDSASSTAIRTLAVPQCAMSWSAGVATPYSSADVCSLTLLRHLIMGCAGSYTAHSPNSRAGAVLQRGRIHALAAPRAFCAADPCDPEDRSACSGQLDFSSLVPFPAGCPSEPQHQGEVQVQPQPGTKSPR